MHKHQSPIPKLLIDNDGFFVYGHRGLSGHKTENTMSSFHFALKRKMNGIELDVQKTLDGEIIVFHDESLEKITGDTTPISRLNFSDISKINVNVNHINNEKDYIPKLIDVINIIPKNIMLNIEIKSYKKDDKKNYEYINDIIDKYNIYENTIISSFDPFILNNIKKRNNKIPIALIWNGKTKFVKSCIKFLKPSAFHININFINNNIVNWMHRRNIKVYAYTVNSTKALEFAKTCNLDGAFTDIDLIAK